MLDIIKILDEGGTVEAGTLRKLMIAGVLPLSFKTSINIYNAFTNNYTLLIDKGEKAPTSTAIQHTADELSVSTITVYRAVKRIEILANL